MGNERDALSELIAENVWAPEPGARRSSSDEMADAILAAGYRKPRTITTAEELDALPVDSVVRTDAGNIFEKGCYPDEPDLPFWITPGMQSMFAAKMLGLPATVLWEPR